MPKTRILTKRIESQKMMERKNFIVLLFYTSTYYHVKHLAPKKNPPLFQLSNHHVSFCFIILAILFLSTLLTACSAYEIDDKEDFSYNNVVVIIGDDHSYTTLGAYGNTAIHSPNLDKLAAEGVRFTNAYSSSPLCSASRQSLLTGKYPHSTGVNLLFTPFNDRTNETIAEHLKDEGFSTALIGKAHFNSHVWWSLYEEFPSFGFDTLITGREQNILWKAHPPKAIPDTIRTFLSSSPYPKKVAQMNPEVLPQSYYDKDGTGTFLAQSAIQFIEDNKQNRFLLWLAFHEPHAPFAFPIEYAGKYNPEEFTLPEGGPEDDRWIPSRFKGFTDEQKKGIIASYYTSVEYMDKNVGLVIDGLKEKGIYDETFIVYLGDQGYLLYDHKRFEKHTMWKESIKAPLIVSGSKHILKNQSFDELIEFIDIAPLICDALGVKPMRETEGRSFYKLCTGSRYQEKEYVFAEFLEDNKAMVANRDWKYIFTTGKRDLGQGFSTGLGASGIVHRLYDLKNDPGETKNVAHQESNLVHLTRMQNMMLARFMETHPNAGELTDKLTMEGKLVWFCEPRDVGAEYGGIPLKTFTISN
jgi:choline-sulfatase